jgi:hypothetical protein
MFERGKTEIYGSGHLLLLNTMIATRLEGRANVLVVDADSTPMPITAVGQVPSWFGEMRNDVEGVIFIQNIGGNRVWSDFAVSRMLLGKRLGRNIVVVATMSSAASHSPDVAIGISSILPAYVYFSDEELYGWYVRNYPGRILALEDKDLFALVLANNLKLENDRLAPESSIKFKKRPVSDHAILQAATDETIARAILAESGYAWGKDLSVDTSLAGDQGDGYSREVFELAKKLRNVC